MESIDDIKSVRYDVCGVVQTVTPNSKAMVISWCGLLFHWDYHENFILTICVGLLGNFNTWAWKCKAAEENGQRKWKILLWGTWLFLVLLLEINFELMMRHSFLLLFCMNIVSCTVCCNLNMSPELLDALLSSMFTVWTNVRQIGMSY